MSPNGCAKAREEIDGKGLAVSDVGLLQTTVSFPV